VLLPDRRPQIDYPITWSYQVIGSDEALMREAVARLVAARAHTLERTKTSRTGKYCSLRLELVVVDEADRLALFEALATHAAVRFVL
jgi:putative lipoic acid-binding regulatory protein